MEAMDLRILQIVQSNPDMAVADIAEKAGLSHTPCWRRLKRLESEGVIRGRATLLDPKALGLTVNVFALIRLSKHDEDTLNNFEAMTKDRPEIVECFSMSGESDYILRVVVRSIDEYEQLLKKFLLHLPGVAAINSSFTLKCVKLTTELPI
jgi:Lrp/AsnC family transcriptional regulator